MQIWNGCNVLNIAGNLIKDINVNVSFLSSGSKVVEWTPHTRIWHLVEIFFKFISQFRIKSCGMDPPRSDIWWKILEILLLPVLANDACKSAINLFPISWGPFENVNLLFSLLKMQIWNGCYVLNIAGNPIKDINVNVSFLNSGSKVVEWTPHTRIWHLVEIFFKFISQFRIKSCGMEPPRSDIWWKSFEILLLPVLSNDACKSAINLFPISWGPFENVNLLFSLLKMQIWNGCNVLIIAGNPIKDINVNVSFLNSGSKVVEWTPHPRIWHLVEIFFKFYFCLYSSMIHAKLWNGSFFPDLTSEWKNLENVYLCLYCL